MAIAIMLTALTAGCTLDDASAPPLQGPSELGLSLAVSANPDVLSHDGASQAQIVVQARDANGQPARSVTFRAEIQTPSGDLVDCGTLSARTLVTNGDGRATFTYTAPMFTCDPSSDQVIIRVVPFGTDAANTFERRVQIRLVPPGTISPGGPTPSFTINGSENTTAVSPFVDVTFDASGSRPGPGAAITSFSWNFGDGTTAGGQLAVHRFSPGTFSVRLTVTDTNNQSRTIARVITVEAGAGPTASFVFSPSSPGINQPIVFNAGASTAAPGRTIVRYDWNFGSGAPQSGVSVTKSYDVAGTYNVVLTVTDDVGQTDTDTRTVVVATSSSILTADFTFSPTDPHNNTQVNFNASGSQPAAQITNYAWDFGDGTSSAVNTTPTISKTYTVTVSTTFIVRLTVTDTAGRTATITRSVQIAFP
jgi:PKD repeat protein